MDELLNFVEALKLLVALGGVAVLVRLYRSYCVDVLCEDLNEIGDELEALASEGVANPDSQAFRRLKIHIDSLQRFADELTGARLMLALLCTHNFEASSFPVTNLRGALDRLPDNEAKRLREVHSRALTQTAYHLLKTSPFVWVLLLLGALGAAVNATAMAITKLPGLDLLVAQAVISESSTLKGRTTGPTPA